MALFVLPLRQIGLAVMQGVSQDLKVARPKLYRNCENIWCTQSVHGERLGAKPITGGVQGPALGPRWGPGASPWWGSRGRSPRKLWAFPLKMIEVLMYFGQIKAPILTVGITEYDHKCHETWTSLAFPTSSRPENIQSLCFGSYLKSTKNIDAPICIVVQNWCNFKWNSKPWVKKYKRFLVLWQCRTAFYH